MFDLVQPNLKILQCVAGLVAWNYSKLIHANILMLKLRRHSGKVSNQPPPHFILQSSQSNAGTEGAAVQHGAVQHGAVQRSAALCYAVRDNDPWLCKPLVSKWLCWSPCIPDACCHFDKYAAHRCPARNSSLLQIERLFHVFSHSFIVVINVFCKFWV